MQKMKTLVLLLMAVATAACGAARAQVVEDQPTLVVPPVPPRTIEPPPAVEPPIIEPVQDLSPPPTAPLKPKSPAARSEAKPEPKPETPPETTTAAATNPPPVEPLRTPTTPSGPEAARQVREALARTESVLSRVDYQKLTADRRATYDAAKGYMQQADEALKKEDITQARMFALRAENVAKQLESR